MQVRRMVATVAVTSVMTLGGTVASGSAASAAPAAPAAPAVFGCNYTNSTPTISYGSTGAAVKEAQCLLRYWGFNPGTIDGIFGTNTKAAVLGFQGWLHISCGLAVDGIVGTHTWHALKNPGC
jgi:peptidoglycan hydrolase-like protein with peptidoglycan-binding domain